MKASINLEWRNKNEPEPTQDIEWVIRSALKKAGRTVGYVFVQGDTLEDKTKIPFSDNLERLPHDDAIC